MTRDEHRAKCIEAMAQALCDFGSLSFTAADYSDEATAAFDALHGIAWIVPVEDTKDWDEEKSQPGWNWRRMAAAGDLTNPPEHFGTSAEMPK